MTRLLRLQVSIGEYVLGNLGSGGTRFCRRTPGLLGQVLWTENRTGQLSFYRVGRMHQQQWQESAAVLAYQYIVKVTVKLLYVSNRHNAS